MANSNQVSGVVAHAGASLHSSAHTPRTRRRAAVIGTAPAMRNLYAIIDRVADTGCNVLVTGEGGTGKALVARGLHDASNRASRPFVVVNCGVLPEALLETELFGQVKGAFSGASATTLGRTAQAQGGTLFLDEIGALSPALQVKLCRLIELREYAAVGGIGTVHADVRVVAATHVDLERAVAAGSFRDDLHSRLNVIRLHVPALRDRREDIALLAQRFLERASNKVGRPGVTMSPATLHVLSTWTWPGNVRELENTVERAVILSPTTVIEPTDLPPHVRASAVDSPSCERVVTAHLPDEGLELRAAVEAFENGLIRQALERTGWNKNQAARLLGLNRTTFVEMLKRKRLATRAA